MFSNAKCMMSSCSEVFNSHLTLWANTYWGGVGKAGAQGRYHHTFCTTSHYQVYEEEDGRRTMAVWGAGTHFLYVS